MQGTHRWTQTVLIWDFDFLKLRYLRQKPLHSTYLRIGRGIVKIVGIRSRFVQTMPLFCCGTKNCGDCESYCGGVKFPKHYVNMTPWIKGCDYGASWTKGIGIDVRLLISVCHLWYGRPWEILVWLTLQRLSQFSIQDSGSKSGD